MSSELEQHLLMVRDRLDDIDEECVLREAALNLLDALETINKNYEKAEMMAGRDGLVRGLNYSTLQLPIAQALSEVVDAPQSCQKITHRGSMYGPTPEPDESCETWAVPGEEFCEEHL